MNLPLINEKATTIFKLLRKSFTSIPAEDLALLCAYIGVTVIRGKLDAEDKAMKQACAKVAHFAHINLLSPKEYESFLLEQSTHATTQQEQISTVDPIGGADQSSTDLNPASLPSPNHTRAPVGTQEGP